jgi:hypothetical protein
MIFFVVAFLVTFSGAGARAARARAGARTRATRARTRTGRTTRFLASFMVLAVNYLEFLEVVIAWTTRTKTESHDVILYDQIKFYKLVEKLKKKLHH